MTLTVGVIGLGYVGLTLTAALARAGHTVYGVDTSPVVLEGVRSRRLHLQEPGVQETLEDCLGTTVHVDETLPVRSYDAVFIAVNTSIDKRHEVRLGPLLAATASVAERCPRDTLVVVRSTVPIGTTRTMVHPLLQEAWGRPLLCMAPERTIQGQALREIVELPQVVGGIDERSLEAGAALFEQISSTVVPVSSTDAAEMVKLTNNAHTDLIYGFGNEVALIAGQHGVDPLEVIAACNLDYPRPDLSRPGFVGGACLTKDPHILMGCTPGYSTPMVRAARQVNEELPRHIALQVLRLLHESRGSTTGGTVAVLGWACKGTPPTDDVRGTAVETLVPPLLAAGVRVLGHDPLVPDPIIRELGGEPGGLEATLRGVDGVVVVTDHPLYRSLDLESLSPDGPPSFVYDVWRILDEPMLTGAGIAYASVGHRAGARDRRSRPGAADPTNGHSVRPSLTTRLSTESAEVPA
ncbi:nucleotide sugar dehydrogenase [Nostocoides sp. F2B08]|uniref:nucleotide sugar dehydrogenase n=1 Tax=Nostocoides sp. F2B08 TaxID=2653936 RepID=UPI00126384FF|nr:nucleotide sugar dehydrogenase [Tetrasphaera sp. F2B08]KAB7744797.1 nucleotide sugar dehydrogenase [Tetrasphaera sp. F2B08]